jgi:2-polyprenyl-3-methyl-5-hydroxy-6-metoxy-1,4-benzoquinol methylase
MICKICSSQSNELFKAKVLNKYKVTYYKCPDCGFIQTEEPFWLKEAYESAISSADTGIVSRNIVNAKMAGSVISCFFNKKEKFLDYGGGYGLFVRLMRDKGFDFYRFDKYSENLFARCFDISELANKNEFELITGFEVFEHLNNPIEEIKEILTFGSTVLFSTEIQPAYPLKNVEDWWYFSPDSGQHISIYSKKTLNILANKLGCNFYSNGKNLHLFTSKKFRINPIKFIYLYYAIFDKVFKRNFNNPKSLIKKDFNIALSKLKS